MVQDSENDAENPKPSLPKPSIPPPDLSRPPPPPPSPLDQPVSAPPPPPPPAPSGEPAVNVKIRTAGSPPPVTAAGGAPFNSRLIAIFIDLVVAAGLVIGCVFFLPDILERLGWLVGFAYLFCRDSLAFLGGQSVGKKAMDLKVVTLDGRQIVNNWEAAIIRNGVLAIPFFPLVELFILLTREDKPERGRRLGDEWAKTKVRVEAKPVAPEDPA